LSDRVIVPYTDFLERRDRRLRVAAELGRHDLKRTIETPFPAGVVGEGTPQAHPIAESVALSPPTSRVDIVK
jgi:hypothetical protein